MISKISTHGTISFKESNIDKATSIICHIPSEPSVSAHLYRLSSVQLCPAISPVENRLANIILDTVRFPLQLLLSGIANLYWTKFALPRTAFLVLKFNSFQYGTVFQAYCFSQ